MILLGHPRSWLTATVLTLAAYRLTRLITVDSLLDVPRSRLLARWPATRSYAPTTLAVCAWCLSVWVAGVELLCWWLSPGVTADLAWVPAVAAVAGIIAERA